MCTNPIMLGVLEEPLAQISTSDLLSQWKSTHFPLQRWPQVEAAIQWHITPSK